MESSVSQHIKRKELIGLTSTEAASRLNRFGPNTPPKIPPKSIWQKILQQFESPLIYILLFALTIELWIWFYYKKSGIPAEILAISIVIIINACLGLWQEWKSESALAAIKKLAAPKAFAIRDGELKQIAASELVPGDLSLVSSGDRIPSDGTVIEAIGLMVDESLLTGESIPIDKEEGDLISSGTLVVRGKGYFEVTKTGKESAIGQIAILVGETIEEKTPLERRLASFGNKVALWISMIALILFAAGVAVGGAASLSTMFLLAVALAVAALPEGLPAVMTVILSIGVQHMSKRQAVVRRLSAVEGLGSVTTIATDKTGTLTENRMEVRQIVSVDEGKLLRAMIFANDTDLFLAAGDPIDIALNTFVQSRKLAPGAFLSAFPRQSTRSFDAKWKYMRVTVKEGDRLISYLKGAPELLLAKSKLNLSEQARWHKEIANGAALGYRMLGFASGDGEAEDNLEWLGIAFLWDPPRPEVSEAVKKAKEAGIRVIMVTGDHPGTALALAKQVGIDTGSLITGQEIEGASHKTMMELVSKAGIFARVSPEQKLQIIEAISGLGEIVAVTGDGINDAPALKRADVGISMGKRGSAVSHEVSDIILLNDNFATIVSAIEEGRSIYRNIQNVIKLLFAANLAEVLTVALGTIGAILFGLKEPSGAIFLPVTAVQLLWINLITDILPTIALAFDRHPKTMTTPPIAPSSPLLERQDILWILLSGGSFSFFALITIFFSSLLGWTPETTRTSIFFILNCQVMLSYIVRQINGAASPNLLLHLAIISVIIIQAIIIYVQSLRDLLGLVPLGWDIWSWIVISVSISLVVSLLGCRYLQKTKKQI